LQERDSAHHPQNFGMRDSCKYNRKIPLFSMMYVNQTIPPDDREIMKKFYELQPEKLPGRSAAEELVNNIAWRIYTEWCCNKEESRYIDHCSQYEGQPYHQWVNDEKLFASQKRQSEVVREAILHAIVKRAMELFGVWRGKEPIGGDKRNLRASLEAYLWKPVVRRTMSECRIAQ
jgi:hypothetical protein